MTTDPAPIPGHRLTSLDVFRGITIAGMILVNNPGSGKAAFAPLKHAEWNGWTPTDLVFPSFLFIVGTALALAFQKRLARGETKGLLFIHALRRSIVLFALGLFYNVFGSADVLEPSANHWQILISYTLAVVGLGLIWPDEWTIARRGWGGAGPRVVMAVLVFTGAILAFLYYKPLFEELHQRVPGVLQRIALCYFLAAVIVLWFGVPGRIFWTAAGLVGYWAIMRYVPPPSGFEAPVAASEGLLHDWIDQVVIGAEHLYRERPDPEGLLSTIPAVATTLLGVLAGNWLLRAREEHAKAAGLLLAGILGIIAGLVLDRWVPINKKIWTPSYVLLAAGFAAYSFGCCYLLTDVQGWRRWAGPFLVLGTNAIAVFMLASLGANLLHESWTIGQQSITPWSWLYSHLAAISANLGLTSPGMHSLIFSLGYVLVWVILFWPLYRARIFIRV